MLPQPAWDLVGDGCGFVDHFLSVASRFGVFSMPFTSGAFRVLPPPPLRRPL